MALLAAKVASFLRICTQIRGDFCRVLGKNTHKVRPCVICGFLHVLYGIAGRRLEWFLAVLCDLPKSVRILGADRSPPHLGITAELNVDLEALATSKNITERGHKFETTLENASSDLFTFPHQLSLPTM